MSGIYSLLLLVFIGNMNARNSSSYKGKPVKLFIGKTYIRVMLLCVVGAVCIGCQQEASDTLPEAPQASHDPSKMGNELITSPTSFINLNTLFGQSKQSVEKSLAKYHKTESGTMPDDDPDPNRRGTEYAEFDIGQGMVLDVGYSHKKTIRFVMLMGTERLECRFEQAPQLLAQFGLGNPGSPAQTAQRAWYWYDYTSLPSKKISAFNDGNGGYISQVQLELQDDAAPTPVPSNKRFGPEIKAKSVEQRAVMAAVKQYLGRFAKDQKIIRVDVTDDWAIGGVVDRAEQTDGGTFVCHKEKGTWKVKANGSAIVSDLQDAGVHIPSQTMKRWFGDQ
jgi:hypothetical protein